MLIEISAGSENAFFALGLPGIIFTYAQYFAIVQSAKSLSAVSKIFIDAQYFIIVRSAKSLSAVSKIFIDAQYFIIVRSG